MDTTLSNPFQNASNSKKLITLIGIIIAMIITIFQAASLAVVLPVAAAEIGGMEYYALANALNTTAGVILMPLWGYIGTRRPDLKRPLFFVSLCVGAVVMIIRAFATSMMIIVIPAFFYAFVGAGVFVLGYSMIRDIYPPVRAGTLLGLLSTVGSLGQLLGPVVSGLVMDFASWRVVCHIIWPFFLVGAILVLMGVRATKAEAEAFAYKGGRFDFPGMLAVVFFLVPLILGLSVGTSFIRFGTLYSNLLFIVAAIALVLLIFIIRKKKGDAFIPAPVLKDRNTLAFMVANLFINFSNIAVFFFMPLYVINIMGLSATEGGLTTTAMSILPIILAPIFGRMIGKSGSARGVWSMSVILRIVIAVALLFVVAPDVNIWIVYAIMFVAGVYNGAHGPSISAGPQIQLDDKIRVQGNSLVQVGQNLGSAIGLAVYTMVIAAFGIVQGMTIAIVLSLIAAALALIFTLMLRKKKETPSDGDGS